MIRGGSASRRPRRTFGATAFGLALLVACGEAPVAPEPATFDIGGPWRADPFSVDHSILSAAAAACPAHRTRPAGGQLRPPLVLVEARGANILTLVFASDADVIQCRVLWTSVGFRIVGGGAITGGAIVPAPANSAIVDSLGTLTGAERAEPGLAIYSTVFGRAGTGVDDVEVHLQGRPPVSAVTANGWFAAWWPGDSQDAAARALDANGRPIGEPDR